MMFNFVPWSIENTVPVQYVNFFLSKFYIFWNWIELHHPEKRSEQNGSLSLCKCAVIIENCYHQTAVNVCGFIFMLDLSMLYCPTLHHDLEKHVCVVYTFNFILMFWYIFGIIVEMPYLESVIFWSNYSIVLRHST